MGIVIGQLSSADSICACCSDAVVHKTISVSSTQCVCTNMCVRVPDALEPVSPSQPPIISDLKYEI